MKNSFLKLCKVFENVENTASRLDMTSLMSDFLKQCSIEDIQVISYLVQGRVGPMFIDSEFNYSEKSLLNLLSTYIKGETLDLDVFKIRQETGDIGDALYQVSGVLSNKQESRSIVDVYEILWDIVNISGTGSVERKGNIIMEFLKKSKPIEAKYFSRIVCGSLRLGLHSKTMMDVFSYMVVGDKSMSDEFNRVYGATSDIGYVASRLNELNKKEVKKSLNMVEVSPGFPIQSRLVERVKSFEEVIERFGGVFLVQGKFDGLRLQIHKYSKSDFEKRETIWKKYYDKNSNGPGLFNTASAESVVKLFTRNLEDVTSMFPEIVQDVQKLELDSVILDSEVLGWDYKEDTFLSYQETMQRRRKYDIDRLKESIPVKAMLFDIMYFEGEDLTGIDNKKRIALLEKNLGGIDNTLRVAETSEVSTVESLEGIFDEYINNRLEGVIVKQLNGGYSPGDRNFEWIKLKKSIDSGLVDTIDMVVVGYYYGSGRRSSLGIGALLAAVYNEDNDSYDAICKVGTGISDDLFKEILEDLKPLQKEKAPKDVVVNDLLKPDVWVSPNIVITVEADEVTRDIGKDKEGLGKGLSLRFPRLIEWNRKKGLENITTVAELESIFKTKS